MSAPNHNFLSLQWFNRQGRTEKTPPMEEFPQQSKHRYCMPSHLWRQRRSQHHRPYFFISFLNPKKIWRLCLIPARSTGNVHFDPTGDVLQASHFFHPAHSLEKSAELSAPSAEHGEIVTYS
jgi:hypothetical protein